MAQENYIGNNGLVTQSLDEILNGNDETGAEGLITQFQNIYGYDINLEQNSPDGQWLNILAQQKKDMLDLFTQYYNNLDTDRVIGIPQQILYKLNGLTIKAFTYSYVYVDVTTTKSLNLEAISNDNLENSDATGYTVSDSNGNRWILTSGTSSSIVSLTAGTTTLNFRAADLGNITALPNTITIMETVIAGVSGVNNPANNYITGDVGETDAEFRTRRNLSMSVPSQGFADSIESQLLNLANVTQAKVYQNRTGSTVDGIPAHTIWVIVEGGNATDIGQTIYNNIPPGIPMKGSQTVSVSRPNGSLESIQYDLPTEEDLYLNITIKLLNGAVDEDYLKEQLAQLTFTIGETVESANITTEIKDIIGNAGSPYNVELSTDGLTYGEIATPSVLNGYFAIKTANINITVVA